MFPPSHLSEGQGELSMRSSLAESLAHIHAYLLRHDDNLQIDVERLTSEVRSHRVVPGVYGRYYELVPLVKGAKFAEARILLSEIANLVAVPPTFEVLPFSYGALGANKDLYSRLLAGNSAAPIILEEPPSVEWTNFSNGVSAALSLVEDADASLATELRSNIVQVVGAFPSSRRGTRNFGGISSFMLWGAVFLNIRQHQTTLDLYEGLVHESAHHALFGLSIGEPLVTNAIEERYASPLRSDPRPMDGVLHATFVCARIHYALSRLRCMPNPPILRGDTGLIDEKLELNGKKFEDGMETVRRHGRLTKTGTAAIDAAAVYMNRT